jgi:hydroxymethylglutaryl-CoA reductase (NADPH)
MAESIPRAREGGSDYTDEMIAERQAFIERQSGAKLDHTKRYSFDPASMAGNVENLFGVAQIPIGLAGPIKIHGEYANGDFYVPLATVEGTLVASYSRGMKVINESGGVTTTVVGEDMQRAPVFVFNSARHARDFGHWLDDNFERVKARAEETTSFGKLTKIEKYLINNFVFTRFDYTTGDAAGQNMTNRATFNACEWIQQSYPTIVHYMLSANFDTEKRASFVNSLHGRGWRVTAELTIPAEVMERNLRVIPRHMYNGQAIANLGSFMSGSTNNAAHPANGLAALFLATGQDAATIGESHQSFVYSRVTSTGDYYYSITLPSLVIATYGGGTNLGSQRECLEMIGCYGPGKVEKLAEIAAATVVAGELSLGAATRIDPLTRTNEWVDAHEKLGRNR